MFYDVVGVHKWNCQDWCITTLEMQKNLHLETVERFSFMWVGRGQETRPKVLSLSLFYQLDCSIWFILPSQPSSLALRSPFCLSDWQESCLTSVICQSSVRTLLKPRGYLWWLSSWYSLEWHKEKSCNCKLTYSSPKKGFVLSILLILILLYVPRIILYFIALPVLLSL